LNYLLWIAVKDMVLFLAGLSSCAAHISSILGFKIYNLWLE